MSIKDKVAVIGTVKTIAMGGASFDGKGLLVEVTVLDYKTSWGKDRWLVTPVAGSGQIWVEADWK